MGKSKTDSAIPLVSWTDPGPEKGSDLGETHNKVSELGGLLPCFLLPHQPHVEKGPGPQIVSPGHPEGLAVAKRPLDLSVPPTGASPPPNRGCCPVTHTGRLGCQDILEAEPLRFVEGTGLPEVSWGPQWGS